MGLYSGGLIFGMLFCQQNDGLIFGGAYNRKDISSEIALAYKLKDLWFTSFSEFIDTNATK